LNVGALLDFTPTQEGANAAEINTTAILWNDLPFVPEGSDLSPSGQSWLFAYGSGLINVANTLGDGDFSFVAQWANPYPINSLAIDSSGILWAGARSGALSYSLFNLVTSTITGTLPTAPTDVQILPAPSGSGSTLYLAASCSFEAFLGYVAGGAITAVQLANAPLGWLLATNGEYALAVAKEVPVTGAGNGVWKSNAAGSAWTQSSTGLAFGKATGLCWSEALNLFVLTTNPGGALAGKVGTFTSPDGVTWTAVGSVLENVYAAAGFYGVVAVDSALLAIGSDDATVVRVWVSLDGGATWYPVPQQILPSSFTNLQPYIAAGPAQAVIGALVLPSVTATTNAYVRFSGLAGTGDQPQT
jgi:hypothetical protein